MRDFALLRVSHRLDNGKQVWYESAWLPWNRLPLALNGLNLDAIYENFVRQIAGEEVNTEKQFNRRVEYNRELRKLKAGLADLENGWTYGKNEM